jgi:hypothetical protein
MCRKNDMMSDFFNRVGRVAYLNGKKPIVFSFLNKNFRTSQLTGVPNPSESG